MEDKNTSSLIAALRWDEHPFINQFLYLEENNNADGSFILSTIIKYQISQNYNVIFVMCHNSLGHFHSISQKLGYNLISLRESGRVYVIEVLEKILNENFLISPESLKELYGEIKNQVDVWGNEKGVCIIVENFGNLLLTESQDFFLFINYLRTIALERDNSSLLVSVHNFPNCPDFNIITKSIRYVADIIINLEDLQTGKANDVTGHLTVTRREEKYKKSTIGYQYQLQDKSISVFIPGARNFI